MHSVFLSYARDDRARAKTVAAALEKAGMTVWWDRRLAAGSEYSKEIEQQLRSAAAVVVLWSRASVDSPWVRDEAGKGRDSGRLVPATLDGTEAPLGFGQFHTIDLSGRRWSQRPLRELVEATAEKLRESGAQPVVPDASAGAAPETKRLRVRPAALATGIVAVAAAAAIYVLDLPDLVTSEADGPAGGKVAIAGFQTIAGDPESQRVAQLAEGAVERTLATNFIQTVAAGSGSAGQSGADFVLRGMVDRAQEQVTILANVIDPDSGRTLWSTEVARPSDEGRQLTEELAILLADVIRCSTYTKRKMPDYDTAEVQSRIFRSCEAERSGGRQYNQLPAVSQALVDVAPDSAQAWAYLSNTTSFIYPERRDQVFAAARKALELDPANGAVRWGLAILPRPTITLARSEELLLEGLRLDPEFLWFRNHLGHLMRTVGRIEDAGRWYHEFVSNYPLDHQTRLYAAYVDAQAGRTIQARKEFDRIAEVRPWFDLNAIYALRAEVFFGNPDNARRWMGMIELSDADRRCVGTTVEALRNERKLSVQEVKRDCWSGEGILHPAQVHAKFGHKDELIAWLEGHDQQYRGNQGPAFVFEPHFATLRSDPRFIPLLVRWGIPQYWLETNKWPDYCGRETLPYDCRKAAAEAVRAAGGS